MSSPRVDIRERILAAWGEFQALEVEHLDLFGSQARDEAGPESDVDVLVHLRGKPTLARLVAVRDRLQALLGRKVDVLTPGALEQRPRLRERILRESFRVA
jgi:predicted nucleotidyltransferase